ncbi:hypothetical protein F2Q70_00030902 [Brassica cretica]|uniref:Uncharacterized protein n=1 Tax=Brassica cretica TaxID=69181 RepID=A0A8S9FEU5_BRACR|nr:hypothetical protein F2Q70_00030902 [Brassica cretica]
MWVMIVRLENGTVTHDDLGCQKSQGLAKMLMGAVCNLQTNQLCLTLIDPHVHYNPIPVKKPQTSSRRINDPGIIAACHCEYETDYSASIDTNTVSSIDTTRKKSNDVPKEESVDSSQGE